MNLSQTYLMTFVTLATAALTSCSTVPKDGGGTTASYALLITVERNLDLNQDFLYVKFLRDNGAVPNGRVAVDGDTLLVSAQEASKSYPKGHWTQSRPIHVAALDSSQGFVYRDSVRMPADFEISDVLPASRVWQPSDANAKVTWGTAFNAQNYTVSVRARSTGSPARGFADYYESSTQLAETIPPTTFRNTYDAVVEDIYDIQVVAYNPNFIGRTGTVYKRPTANDISVPISTDEIIGGLSALVVSARDTLRVQVL
ncbi:MAG: hypothetical protein HY304_07100 [candidate division Zixibacteria bacterium]|nr:hypothetical protein [candidate division Zixibacteria bacterium]